MQVVAASNDVASVRDQLVSAINGASSSLLRATAGAQAGDLLLTASTAGEGFKVEVEVGRQSRAYQVTVAEGKTSHSDILAQLAHLLDQQEDLTTGTGAYLTVDDQSAADQPALLLLSLIHI